MGGGTRRTGLGATMVVLALGVGLTAPSAASAAADPLSGGSVVLQLKSKGGLKVKPKSLSLPITGGSLDPTTGAGNVQVAGKFRLRHGRDKAKVKVLRINPGPNGGPGTMDVKIGKQKVNGFGKTSGGSLTRDGWGAKLEGVTLTLRGKGAKALSRAFSGKKGKGKKGKASAAAGKKIKGGTPLGTVVSLTTVPKQVEVLPGGTLVFEADPLFAIKLARHCINATIPDVDPSLPHAVEAIPPALNPTATEFIFPVTGGSIAPNLSTGRVLSAGGQKITKNDPGILLAGCSQEPAVGTSVLQVEFEAQFDIRALASNTTLPTGNIGIGALGPFDLAAATTSADSNTKQITVTGAPVTMDPVGASVFNAVFPNRSGNPNNDFMGGDSLGTLSLTVTTH